MTATDIGLELRLFRVKNKIQAQSLAKNAEISPYRLSRIENGWEQPNKEIIDSLIRGYTKLGVKATTLRHVRKAC